MCFVAPYVNFHTCRLTIARWIRDCWCNGRCNQLWQLCKFEPVKKDTVTLISDATKVAFNFRTFVGKPSNLSPTLVTLLCSQRCKHFVCIYRETNSAQLIKW